MNDFKKTLVDERVKQGISCKKLAEKAGCTERAISYLENGQRKPSLEFANRVLEALGIEMIIGKENQ